MKSFNENRLIKISILLAFFVMGEAVSATPFILDLKTAFNGRTYPIGPQLAILGGGGVPLYGDLSSWKYGYVRLGANLATSAIVNRAGLEAQVFPISIFGISVGADTAVRNFTPRWLDCSVLECNGRVDRRYVKGVLLGAVKSVSFMVSARYEELRSFSSAKPFFDEMTLTRGRSVGEHLLTWNPVLLYTINSEWKVGAMSLYTRALDSGGSSNMWGPLGSWSDSKKWNLLFGVGLNESMIVHSGFTAFFSFQYTIEPSIAVSDLPLRQNLTPDVSEALR